MATPLLLPMLTRSRCFSGWILGDVRDRRRRACSSMSGDMTGLSNITDWSGGAPFLQWSGRGKTERRHGNCFLWDGTQSGSACKVLA